MIHRAGSCKPESFHFSTCGVHIVVGISSDNSWFPEKASQRGRICPSFLQGNIYRVILFHGVRRHTLSTASKKEAYYTLK